MTGSTFQVGLFLTSIGLLIGFVKGKFILAKTVKQIVFRIISFPPY